MTRMVISSFYYTLINSEESIETSTMLEIDRIRSKNILFTIITNRHLKEILYYNRDFPFIDYVISLNGAHVYDLTNNKCIIENHLDKNIVSKIKKLFPNNKIIYYTEENEFEEQPNEKVLKIEIEVSKKELKLINNLKQENIYTSILKYDNKYYIEITKNSIEESIIKLLNKLKINKSEVVSIIGNESEKDIINLIEKTYVVSNAPKELKLLANNKTKSNDKKGVEQVLMRL